MSYASLSTPSFNCGVCEWNEDGTIRYLSFDCPVHAPHDDRAFPQRSFRVPTAAGYINNRTGSKGTYISEPASHAQ